LALLLSPPLRDKSPHLGPSELSGRTSGSARMLVEEGARRPARSRGLRLRLRWWGIVSAFA
jgi:hypothetical protein